jgi:hypothetical protein
MPNETNKNFKGTFKSAIDLDTIKAAKKGELPTEIPVLPKGEFMTQPYGNMVLDDNIFDQMISNFNKGVRRAVPLDVDHAWENTRAAGWITELKNTNNGLVASVEYTPFGEELVKGREYRMISAEWSFDYVDPQHSTHHGIVLIAATLTNRPLMQSMPTITASDKNLTKGNDIMILFNQNDETTMNIQDILAKNPADRTEDEVKFLQEKAEELTDEQKTQLEKEGEDSNDESESAEDNSDSKGEGDGEDSSEGEESEDGEESEEGEEDTTASEDDKEITIKASELARFQKMEAEAKEATEVKKATEFAQPFMASSTGGKVLPKAKDALLELSRSLSADQKDLLSKVLKATADQKITSAKGEDDTAGATASQKYNELVSKYMSKGLTGSQANTKVRKEHKEVYANYLKESGNDK